MIAWARRAPLWASAEGYRAAVVGLRDDVGVGSEITPPSGTVTFLFTDVEGSTKLWAERAELMSTALAEHDRVIRAAAEAHRGFVFSTAGDSFAIAFSVPADALAAARQAQRGVAAISVEGLGPIRVRMGIHSGVAEERDENYFGPSVNRAARIMSAGHGGQVLVSETTAPLVGGAGLVDLGEFVLRDLPRAERLWQDAQDQFPPLRTSDRSRGNLPEPASSFLGRQDEIDQVIGLSSNERLVSLVGPGGVGKTRLAIQSGLGLAERVADGVWFCDLAAVGDGSSVGPAIASSVSAPLQEGLTVVEALVSFLASSERVLVVDNCEHVIDEAAGVIDAIVAGAPRVHVLATSREPLDIPGEAVWPVAGLDASEALFIDRARLVNATLSLTDDDHAAIAELCARLDHMPLAIELAAARTRTFSFSEILANLDDWLRLLRGRRGGLDRQQSLEAAVRWSYDLLDQEEQALFSQLSIFAGTFDLAAARAIFLGDPDVPAGDVLERMESLVQKSLVEAARAGSSTRFRLLETFRQFGRQQLDDTADLALRHLDYYDGVVAQASDWYHGSRSGEGAALFQTEWDNIRAAFNHALSLEACDRTSAIVERVFDYSWFSTINEVADWAERNLNCGTPTPPAIGACGFWALVSGDVDRTRELAQTAISQAPRPDHPDTVIGWLAQMVANAFTGDTEATEASIRQWQKASHSDPFHLAWSTAGLSMYPSATDQDLDRAQQLVSDLRNDVIDAFAQYASARRLSLNNPAAAHGSFVKAAELNRTSGATAIVGLALAGAAQFASAAHVDPGPHYIDALHWLHGRRQWSNVAQLLEVLAIEAHQNGAVEQAATIAGQLKSGKIRGALTDRYEAMTNNLERDSQARSWLAQGGEMTRDEVVAYAVNMFENISLFSPAT